MGLLKKINVVFVYVADVEQARKFYEGTLGLGKPVVKTPLWVEYELEGGSHLALHKADAEQVKGADRSRGTVKFSIVVENLEKAHEELGAKGVHFVRPPEKGYGFQFAEFEDPEGNRLRLIQFHK